MYPQAADYINVTNKTVLVIGTQTPWVEAVLLSKKPRKVVTLEYGYYLRYIAHAQLCISRPSSLISEYPGFSFIRPDEFRARYLDGTLDTFDAIFSYSSIEHSGLGEF